MPDEAIPDILMPLTRLKPLLQATKEPGNKLPCVVGLDLSGEGVIAMARAGSPKKLRKDVLATIKAKSLGAKIKTDAQTILIGYASTDVGREAILKIALNREPMGAAKLASKLLRRVKSSGFEEVIFSLDKTIDAERDAEAGEDGADTVPHSDDPLEQRYRLRMAALEPDIAMALQQRVGDVGKLRTVADFAREKAEGGNFEAALKALDMVEKLLAPAASNEVAVDVEHFGQLHERWDQNKEQVHRALSKLHDEIVGEFDDPEATSAADTLSLILARFNKGLGDTLDNLREASSGELRTELATKAGSIAGLYLSYLATDPLIAHVEANPYDVAVDVKATLSAPLSAIQAEAAKLATAPG